MNSDSHFCIGSGHNVCQDYALSGKSAHGEAYAIVSDGCSGSPDTDFGSRLLSISARRALEIHSGTYRSIKGSPEKWLLPAAANSAYAKALACYLNLECLDATILVALEIKDIEDPGTWVEAAGDGIIVARHRGSAIFDTHIIEFPSGFPAYPNYMLSKPRLEGYVGLTDGGAAEVSVTTGDSNITNKGSHCFYPRNYSLNPYTYFFLKKKYDLVLLLTDGALTFQQENCNDTSKVLSHVPLEAVVRELLDFKSLNGEFVTRRAKKFLSKTCVDNKWSHYDDFSVAAIAMD